MPSHTLVILALALSGSRPTQFGVAVRIDQENAGPMGQWRRSMAWFQKLPFTPIMYLTTGWRDDGAQESRTRPPPWRGHWVASTQERRGRLASSCIAWVCRRIISALARFRMIRHPTLALRRTRNCPNLKVAWHYATRRGLCVSEERPVWRKRRKRCPK